MGTIFFLGGGQFAHPRKSLGGVGCAWVCRQKKSRGWVVGAQGVSRGGAQWGIELILGPFVVHLAILGIDS